MNTLLLDTVAWDLTLDITGNIAMASDPYSEAQDAASGIRLFAGELWFDTTQGIPYWTKVLDALPPLSLVRSLLTQTALTVPNVASAQCFFTSFSNRVLKGQVQITNEHGQTSSATF